jgi:hypothetical protein
MELQRLLRPDEVARLLGVAVDTLAVWRCTKRVLLPYVKCGKHVRYEPSAVSAFIAARRVGGDEVATGGGR